MGFYRGKIKAGGSGSKEEERGLERYVKQWRMMAV